jgi:transketolase C-terminal domain/subunit
LTFLTLVSEVVAERGLPCRVVRYGADDMPRGVSGSEAYFHRRYGLEGEQLAERIRSLVGTLEAERGRLS